MEGWQQRFNNRFLKDGLWRKEHTPNDVISFIKDTLRKDRKRDKLQELIDHVKESKTRMQILFTYVQNNWNKCESLPPSKLSRELGLSIHSGEAQLLTVLERYFKEHPKPE